MYVLLTASEPLVGVPKDVILLLPIDKAPVIESPALATLVPMDVATVVAKLASSPRAAANSSKVSSAAGADATMAATLSSTYFLVEASVSADGVPRPVILYVAAARSEPKVPLVIVLDVRVDATPSRVTVPVALGRVIVRSAVGSVARTLVS
jgi:hypothetical protein